MSTRRHGGRVIAAVITVVVFVVADAGVFGSLGSFGTLVAHAAPTDGCGGPADRHANVLDQSFAQPIGGWKGGDVPQPYELPDGRVLWMLNDSFVDDAAPGGPIGATATFLHNVAVVQSGSCFELRTGPFVAGRRTSFLSTGETTARWWWFHGGVVVGNQLRVIVTAQIATVPGSWAVTFSPVATMIATYDWRSLRLLSLVPAGDPAVAPVYGFSVASDDTWTYLFGQRDELRFPNGSKVNTVARIPRGALTAAPEYWDGATWQPDRSRAASVSTNGTWNHRMRVVFTGERWLAVAKEDEFFGRDVVVLEAPAPQGPWSIITRVAAPTRTGDDSTATYDAVPVWAPIGDRLTVSWSNNAFDYADVAHDPRVYRPSFREIELPSPVHSNVVCAGEPVGRSSDTLVSSPAAVLAPVAPVRLIDTRNALATSAPGAPAATSAPGAPGLSASMPLPEAVTVVDIATAADGPSLASATAGGPAPVVAAVVNVTMTAPAGAGHVTAWPSGAARPLSSVLNADRAGATVANLVTVAVGADGKVDFTSNVATHLVVDLYAVYRAAPVKVATATIAPQSAPAPAPPPPPPAPAPAPKPSPIAAGRFHALTPARLIDSRDGGAKPLTAGSIVAVPVLGRGGVPSSGVAAVAVTITGTEAVADGFVTVWGNGELPPVSSLNLERGGTRANQLIVPVGSDGTVRVFTQSGTHVIVDVAGWFTDATAAPALDGRFVPVVPTRLTDSRVGLGRPAGGCTATVTMPAAAVAAQASAVAINLTMTDTMRAGYAVAWPAGVERPIASNQNVERAGQTRPVHALVALSKAGAFSIYEQNGGHLVVDIDGWFTGAT